MRLHSFPTHHQGFMRTKAFKFIAKSEAASRDDLVGALDQLEGGRPLKAYLGAG